MLRKFLNTTIETILFGLLSFVIQAQELPPIRNYSPGEYGAENQNWAISQDEDYFIYIANNQGLLVYNRAQWMLYPSPNETIMRSVKVIGDKIFTGCYMEFGYWQKNNFGDLTYTSLTKSIDIPLKEDEHFWKILGLDNWVLFQSYNRIYIYDSIAETFEIVESDATIYNLFEVNGTIYFQKFGKGLYKIQSGKDVLVSSDSVFHENVIVNVYAHNEGLLVHTQNDGIYVLKGNELVKWQSEINITLNNISVYCSLQLKDGTLIIGTISHGVYHFNEQGKFQFQIDQRNGLINNTVLSVFEDVKNNIWLGLDNGISSININSPVKVFFDNQGQLGAVYTSALYKENLYLGTNQGLFYKKYDSKSEFKFISGTQGQVWSLDEIEGTLFCSHNSGTFSIDSDKATKIANIQGTWLVKPIPNNSELLLQGNYDGLYILEKKDKWELRNKIKGFDNSSRYFEIDNTNTIFINHEYKGVFKIQVDKDYQTVNTNTTDSIGKGLNSSILKYNGKILYAYKEGVFFYDYNKNTFVRDSIFKDAFTKENYTSGKLIKTKNDLLWIFNDDVINYFTPGKLTVDPVLNQISIPSHLRNTVTSYESVLKLNNEKYLIGTTSGFITIDFEKFKALDFEVTIHNATCNIHSTSKILDLSENPDIDYTHNSLNLAFSAPEYSKFFEIEYQTRLEGIYDQWSNWTTSSNEVYENLPAGNYTFQVRARIGSAPSTNIESYSFTILSPWYFSNGMIAVYILLLLLGIIIIHNIYKAYYKKVHKKLLLDKQKEMDLKELENNQERMQLKNQNLKQDIENKNRELAISTMSLIRKNEFLNDIKVELKKLDHGKELNNVVRIIDKKLNNTDDWKLFEEAFNNADKNFLKKVKKNHPGLTPNDLRLCAYLRLNLSSKEIAPLLNISPRSVEVKRYRLRKKMQLGHEDSLSNYILEM